MFDAASKKEAKVSSIMKHGDLFWAGARSESIAAIQMKLFEVSIEGGVLMSVSGILREDPIIVLMFGIV
jgi:hypothetical protein